MSPGADSTPAPASYSITDPGIIANGSVTADKNKTVAGETVKLTITPENGYELEKLIVSTSESVIIVSGSGNERTFEMPAGDVTITASFAPIFVGTPCAKYDSLTINGTQYDLVEFGDWPQTRAADGVTINMEKRRTIGVFTYYKGNDDQWYAESKGKYYKVEPIKWRVLTNNYNGKKLLLSEKVLIGKRYDASNSKYESSEIRAWLNAGFLNTAFTADERGKIAYTMLDNSANSAFPSNYDEIDESKKNSIWNNGVNPYVSDTPTRDKVFFLSLREVTNSEYGFKVQWSEDDNMRLRAPTDYASISYVYNNGNGYWWLRSPCYRDSTAYIVDPWGLAGYGDEDVDHDGIIDSGTDVNKDDYIGVVPALCLE